MELLDERWTMLVIREVLLGSRHFNDIRGGVPKMSPSLLSKRLRDLTRAGIVERRDQGRQVAYGLTAAGNAARWAGAFSTCRAEVVPGFAIRPGTSVSG